MARVERVNLLEKENRMREEKTVQEKAEVEMMARMPERSKERRREEYLPTVDFSGRTGVGSEMMAVEDCGSADVLQKRVVTEDACGNVAKESWHEVATGITLGDIEEFIARTLHSTGDAQGSDAHEQGANSQEGRAGLLPK